MFWGRALFQEELLPRDSGNVLWGTKGSKGQSAAHKKQTKGFKAVTFRKSAACQGDVVGFFLTQVIQVLCQFGDMIYRCIPAMSIISNKMSW